MYLLFILILNRKKSPFHNQISMHKYPINPNFIPKLPIRSLLLACNTMSLMQKMFASSAHKKKFTRDRFGYVGCNAKVFMHCLSDHFMGAYNQSPQIIINKKFFSFYHDNILMVEILNFFWEINQSRTGKLLHQLQTLKVILTMFGIMFCICRGYFYSNLTLQGLFSYVCNWFHVSEICWGGILKSWYIFKTFVFNDLMWLYRWNSIFAQ